MSQVKFKLNNISTRLQAKVKAYKFKKKYKELQGKEPKLEFLNNYFNKVTKSSNAINESEQNLLVKEAEFRALCYKGLLRIKK